MSGPQYEHDVPKFRNHAARGANVGAQASYVAGDLNVAVDSETPEEKAERGENLLGRGMSREAEQFLGDAISEGRPDPRTAYYWALSILSGRSLEQVEADHLTNLEFAFRTVSGEATDTWSRALRVVEGLIELLRTVDQQQNETAPGNESEILEAYDNLSSERTAEIRRYMDQVLDGVVLEHIHRAAAEEVARERFSNGRIDRASKFFEPEPAAPEWIPPPPKPRRLWAWLKLIGGIVLAGVAAIPLIPAMARASETLTLGLGLLGAGVFGMAHYGLQRRFIMDDREIEQRMFAPPMVGGWPWNVEGQAKFAEKMVVGAFNRCAPSQEEKESWKEATKRYQLNLIRQFVEVYQNSEVFRRPSVVRWLAEWHAERLAERWDPEREDVLYGSVRVPARVYLGMSVATVVAVWGAALSWEPLLVDGVFETAVLFPIAVACGIRVAIDQGCWLISSARAFAKDTAASDRRYESERGQYNKLCEFLVDRPDDAEMSRWLDYDQRHLRAKAMELYQITNPELITHFTFAAPAETARHMTASGGPKRYTNYVIGILLMTRGGVRLAEFQLDMRTGEDDDHVRRSFRYEAIASVHVTTVRADRNHPFGRDSKRRNSKKKGDQEDVNNEQNEREMEKPGLRTIFRIVLVNREEVVSAFFDVFDDEIDESQQDAHELVARALDVSGVAGALWMVESIIGDGKEWLKKQEARSRRRRYRSQSRAGDRVVTNGNGSDHTGEPVLT